MIQTEREYAQALFKLAVEENSVEEYLESLKKMKKLLEENPEYTEFLNCPAVSLTQRLAAIDEAFGEMLPEYVLSLVKLLCENGKSRITLSCIDEFLALAMEYKNSAYAQIYSVIELNDQQKKSICKKLEKITNKNIVPVYSIDKSLIGGIKVEVDGKTIDFSIKHRLGDIKDVMNS